MKKLIFTLAVACAAVVAQAASYAWSCLSDGVVYPEQGGNYFAGTAYLIDANKTSQGSFLTAFSAVGFDIANYQIATATLPGTYEGFGATEFSYDGQAGGSIWKGYMAVIDGDNVFIGDLTDNITAPSDQSTKFISIPDPYDASVAALKTDYSGFEGAGWYAATQPVPEPTSGLLVLMGLAGLMLRRKRA